MIEIDIKTFYLVGIFCFGGIVILNTFLFFMNFYETTIIQKSITVLYNIFYTALVLLFYTQYNDMKVPAGIDDEYDEFVKDVLKRNDKNKAYDNPYR